MSNQVTQYFSLKSDFSVVVFLPMTFSHINYIYKCHNKNEKNLSVAFLA